MTPESYTEEGEARENIDSQQDDETKRESAAGPRRSVVKRCRTQGLPYVTETSGIDKRSIVYCVLICVYCRLNSRPTIHIVWKYEIIYTL